MVKISAVNAIPAMTSNTSPSGVVRSSGVYSTFYDWMAFDDNYNNTQWQTTGSSGWLSYEFIEPLKIGRYAIVSGGTANQSPRDWTFEGSNDGEDWTILDTKENVSFVAAERAVFEVESLGLYKIYRLNIAANNGNSSYTVLRELEMYEVLHQDKILLLSEDNKAVKIVQNHYETPIMTSNTSNGVAKASSIRSNSYDAWKAFNNVFDASSGAWFSASGSPRLNSWLSYTFNESAVIDTYEIYGMDSAGSLPKVFRFEGSNDENNWVVLDEQDISLSEWVINEWNKFNIPSNKVGKYKTYRIFIATNNGNGSYTAIPEMRMSGNESYLVQVPDKTEDTLIEHGMDLAALSEIDMSRNLKEKHYIQNQSIPLGEGKVFEQPLNHTIKKISIK